MYPRLMVFFMKSRDCDMYLVIRVHRDLCRVDSFMETPSPIPNLEVKHVNAECSRKVRIGNATLFLFTKWLLTIVS